MGWKDSRKNDPINQGFNMTFSKKRGKEYQKDQKEFFDSLIEKSWETYHIPEWDFTRTFETNWIALKTNPKKILNVGCGCGFHDQVMSQIPSVENILGIDYSRKTIQKAESIYPHKKIQRKFLDFLKDDINQLGKFDLTVSFQVIEHLEEYELFLRRMMQVTENNGFIAIATPNYNRLSNRIKAWFGKKKTFCDVMHFTEFTYKELCNLGEKVGVSIYASMSYNCSFNFKFDLDRYIPHKIRFYLGRLFPQIGDVMVLIFKKP